MRIKAWAEQVALWLLDYVDGASQEKCHKFGGLVYKEDTKQYYARVCSKGRHHYDSHAYGSYQYLSGVAFDYNWLGADTTDSPIEIQEVGAKQKSYK